MNAGLASSVERSPSVRLGSDSKLAVGVSGLRVQPTRVVPRETPPVPYRGGSFNLLIYGLYARDYLVEDIFGGEYVTQFGTNRA